MTRCSTPAVCSCADSSGGRRSVLNGTTVAPARLAPNAATGHAVPFGMRMPTRLPLPTPAAANQHATAPLARSRSRYVSRSSSDTTNDLSGCSRAQLRTNPGTVRRSVLTEPVHDLLHVGLSRREHRQVVGREHRPPPRHLVRRQPRPERLPDLVDVEAIGRFG